MIKISEIIIFDDNVNKNRFCLKLLCHKFLSSFYTWIFGTFSVARFKSYYAQDDRKMTCLKYTICVKFSIYILYLYDYAENFYRHLLFEKYLHSNTRTHTYIYLYVKPNSTINQNLNIVHIY